MDVVYFGILLLTPQKINPNLKKPVLSFIGENSTEILRDLDGYGILWNLAENAENQSKFGEAGSRPLKEEILRKILIRIS